MDELFDGDSKTYKMFKGHDPYVRFQFNTSAKIDQLDITFVLGRYAQNIYTEVNIIRNLIAFYLVNAIYIFW